MGASKPVEGALRLLHRSRICLVQPETKAMNSQRQVARASGRDKKSGAGRIVLKKALSCQELVESALGGSGLMKTADSFESFNA